MQIQFPQGDSVGMRANGTVNSPTTLAGRGAGCQGSSRDDSARHAPIVTGASWFRWIHSLDVGIRQVPCRTRVTGTLDRTARDDNGNTEKIRSTRTYSLVARVVVRLPEEQAGREESTAWKLWDAVALDAFVQVVGLPMWW